MSVSSHHEIVIAINRRARFVTALCEYIKARTGNPVPSEIVLEALR